MSGTISHGAYKDQDAVVLENDLARAVLLPAHGGKTISLMHKGLGVETLWQNTATRFTGSKYGDPYERGEFAGFDECFPRSPAATTKAFRGPVSRTPITARCGACRVGGYPWERRHPGRQRRPLPIPAPKTVSLEGQARWRTTWRPTFLFPSRFHLGAPAVQRVGGHAIHRAGDMRQVRNAVPGTVLSGYGERSFPVARRDDGSTVRLDRVPPRNCTGFQKYWLTKGRSPRAGASCTTHSTGLGIGLTLSTGQGTLAGNVAERGRLRRAVQYRAGAATPGMDRIDSPRMWGVGSTLAPGGVHEWDLVITLGKGAEPRAMDRNGGFIR